MTSEYEGQSVLEVTLSVPMGTLDGDATGTYTKCFQ